MPTRVMDKVWAYFDAVGPLTGVPWPITYREPEQHRLARLRGWGVRAFPSLLYPHKPGMAAWLNDWATGFAAEQPDVVHTLTFFPEPDAAGYVDQALRAGARMAKVHLQVGAFDPRDPLLDEVWGALADAGTVAVVHCGHGPVPGPFTGPGPFAEVLARHPRLTAVVAHFGMPDYEQFLDLADRFPALRLDTTMAFTAWAQERVPLPPALLPRVAALRDRIVLGTDFPNIPYSYAEQLRGLARLGLGADWLRAVLHDNGAELVELPAD